jgi:hypothetical protein
MRWNSEAMYAAVMSKPWLGVSRPIMESSAMMPTRRM